MLNGIGKTEQKNHRKMAVMNNEVTRLHTLNFNIVALQETPFSEWNS